MRTTKSEPTAKPDWGEHADEGGGGDEVEPVAEQADDLAEPKVAEVAVVAKEVSVADGGLRSGICGHVV